MGALVAVVVLVAVMGGAAALATFLRRKNQELSSGSGRGDPFTIGEPWRRHVAAAQSAQRRYRTQVQALPAGPLKARMAEIGRQVDRGVADCWEVARHGHQLDRTIRDLDAASIRARLDRATAEREVVSLRAQLASVDRIRASRDDAESKLRVLQTRLGELVGRAAELTHDAGGASLGAPGALGSGSAGELGSAVDDVVTQLEALRLAMREVDEPMLGFDGDGGPPR